MLLLIVLIRIDFGKLSRIIYQVNISYLLVVIALNIPQLFLKSYRWNCLLKQQDIHYSQIQSFLVYLSSLYIGCVTPGRLGEFVKVLYLKSGKCISLSKGMSSVILDRLFDLYLLMILGVIGLWKFDIMGKLSNTALFLLVVIVLAPLFVLNKQLARKLVNLLYYLTIIKKVKGNVEERFVDFYDGINQLISPRLLFSILLTCISYFIIFTQCYLILIAVGISINFITITLFMAISNLISFIPISISGLGTRDVTLIYLFSLIGLTSEIAVSYAFLVFITFFVCGGLMGAVAWWIKPLETKRSI